MNKPFVNGEEKELCSVVTDLVKTLRDTRRALFLVTWVSRSVSTDAQATTELNEILHRATVEADAAELCVMRYVGD